MNSKQSLEISLDRIAIMEVIQSVTYIPDKNKEIHVHVTHIVSPHNFFVRPSKFNKLLPAVQQYEGRFHDMELHYGRIVIYESKIKSQFIRGQIIQITTTDECILYNLYTPDHGFIETGIKSNAIWKPVITDVPPLVQRCCLNECYPKGDNFSEDAIDAMKFFLKAKPIHIIVIANTPEYLTVDVITATGDVLARMMFFSNYTYYFCINTINRHYVPKLEPEQKSFIFRSLKVGDVLHIRIQSAKSSQGFFVAQMDEYQDYLKRRRDITLLCKQKGKLECKQLQEGQAVAVPHPIYSTFLERAIIKEILDPEKVILQLIDWGSTMQVYTSRLFTMTEQFFDVPALAIYCATKDNEACGSNMKLLPGCIFEMVIKRTGDKFNSPNIVDLTA